MLLQNLLLVSIIAVFAIFIFDFCFFAHAQSQIFPSIRITSISKEIVPENGLMIKGTSTDSDSTACQVFVHKNNSLYSKKAIATGPGGPGDFSDWSILLNQSQNMVTKGDQNQLIAVISCIADDGTLRDNSYSINVNVSESYSMPSNNGQQGESQKGPNDVTTSNTNSQASGNGGQQGESQKGPNDALVPFITLVIPGTDDDMQSNNQNSLAFKGGMGQGYRCDPLCKEVSNCSPGNYTLDLCKEDDPASTLDYGNYAITQSR
jgi:hypothetical protein